MMKGDVKHPQQKHSSCKREKNAQTLGLKGQPFMIQGVRLATHLSRPITVPMDKPTRRCDNLHNRQISTSQSISRSSLRTAATTAQNARRKVPDIFQVNAGTLRTQSGFREHPFMRHIFPSGTHAAPITCCRPRKRASNRPDMSPTCSSKC